MSNPFSNTNRCQNLQYNQSGKKDEAKNNVTKQQKTTRETVNLPKNHKMWNKLRQGRENLNFVNHSKGKTHTCNDPRNLNYQNPWQSISNTFCGKRFSTHSHCHDKENHKMQNPSCVHTKTGLHKCVGCTEHDDHKLKTTNTVPGKKVGMLLEDIAWILAQVVLAHVVYILFCVYIYKS